MNTELITSHGALESSKKALENDLKTVVGDAGNLLNEVANSTVEEFAAVRNRVEARFDDARASLHEARLAVAGKAKGAADATQKYVIDNPWKVIGIMAATGVIVGLLSSRRH